MRHFLTTITFAFGLTGFAASGLAATQYPLTISNCGQKVTFQKAPAKIVSIGQGMTEILFSLGLADKIAGTAVWVGPVLPQYAEANARIPRLADNDPSFESVVGKEPDLVAAEFEWHVGPQGSVGKREQFSELGINTYIAPTDCVAKVNADGGDGVRKELFTMDLIYQEIGELAEIFDVEDRGDALIADLKKREADAVASISAAKSKDLPIVFWFSSKEVGGDAFIAGKNSAPAYILKTIGARNVVTTEEEWPLVGWETIAQANPAVIVIATMDRRRYAADDPKVKLEFLEKDPVTSQLDAVRNKHFVLMDAQSMNPTIRTIDGIEILAKGIRSFGLAR
ncbi:MULTISPECIES: ABC transporter substrate-binding protein [unclassified Rhizobium]|uniref:ABC transporter substrate-binding protein n=1 Tax=unclassified Rhizobium TaxID=2613769 RepID=UPI00119BC78C|nr:MULTISPECIES: ABC transporter substrate-binding protein [unclassified Rhizobium]MBB3285091.1 iron complex transport system substrate-binding protein [Rhizobium sp. BK252]MBB3399830.1 iron complex transport system substrate-binding protein [Rhizobium sp. BK289]MBB3412410.1 iron complex transport system substrate-binding protein [Rhizobium sp. BK284]MBB3480296.1 iron complex transport system substrate-binding protein [Rhizobium sp. BK347]MDK4718969.1 ABC transporter substrate-binding protein 